MLCSIHCWLAERTKVPSLEAKEPELAELAEMMNLPAGEKIASLFGRVRTSADEGLLPCEGEEAHDEEV